MPKSEKEWNKAWIKKFVAHRRLVANPPATLDASSIDEALERGPAAAAVIAPVESAVRDDLGSHVLPPTLKVVGSEETADEEVVPIPISIAIEDEMAPIISAAPLGIEQSGEDQPCKHSGSPDVLGCVEETDALISSIASPARICQNGAGKIEEVPSPVAEPEADDAPRASSPLMKERTDLSPVGLISRSSSPVEDESSSRKRRRESEFCLPSPLLPPPSITINPSSAPPSSGSCIPELEDLQHFASLLGKHSISPVAWRFMERQSSCMRMKAALKALSEVGILGDF